MIRNVNWVTWIIIIPSNLLQIHDLQKPRNWKVRTEKWILISVSRLRPQRHVFTTGAGWRGPHGPDPANLPFCVGPRGYEWLFTFLKIGKNPKINDAWIIWKISVHQQCFTGTQQWPFVYKCSMAETESVGPVSLKCSLPAPCRSLPTPHLEKNQPTDYINSKQVPTATNILASMTGMLWPTSRGKLQIPVLCLCLTSQTHFPCCFLQGEKLRRTWVLSLDLGNMVFILKASDRACSVSWDETSPSEQTSSCPAAWTVTRVGGKDHSERWASENGSVLHTGSNSTRQRKLQHRGGVGRTHACLQWHYQAPGPTRLLFRATQWPSQTTVKLSAQVFTVQFFQLCSMFKVFLIIKC